MRAARQNPRDEDTGSAGYPAVLEAFGFLFDIVNGFLKSMPRGVGFKQGAQLQGCGSGGQADILVLIIWLRLIIPHRITRQRCSAELVIRKGCPALMLVVWALKREVRAIRGCLGAYRR